MYPWVGKWALVTGASAGIGVALAAELAAAGTNLVLTARREDRLTALARDLAAKNNIRTEICVADLADPAAPDSIFAFVRQKNLHIDLLVNNAGFGAYGEFAASDRARQIEMVQVNCSAVVNLTHLFLQPMLQRKSGDILIVASTAAFQAVPYITTYAATKVFDLYLAEGLAVELKPFGIRVCGQVQVESDAGDRAHVDFLEPHDKSFGRSARRLALVQSRRELGHSCAPKAVR